MNLPVEEANAQLTGVSIVCFAPNPWHDIWRNRQHIFSRLALNNTVLYVEPKAYSLARLRRNRAWFKSLSSPRLQHEGNGLWLYRHPVWAPLSNRPGIRQLTWQLRRLALRRAMAQLGMRRPISWVFQPKHAELVGHLGEHLVVYHVVDEYTAFRHYSDQTRQRVQEGERQLLSRADMVIATSQALQAAKASLASAQVVWVANGVDFAAFERVRRAIPCPPRDMAHLKHPIVGYIGHISGRLNLPLLAEIARRRPNWSLVLVGSVAEFNCEAELAALYALPNIHFLGKKEACEVPHYIYAFDACLIPYCPGEEAFHINPIKLYEYMAAGKPVVTIDIPALNGFRHLLYTADSVETFVASLESALNEPDPTVADDRRRLAAENSWDHRVKTIKAALAQVLTGKGYSLAMPSRGERLL